ncbi:MAG: hypothetical protein Kow0065_21860 [Methylomicrobium sp.]
MAIDPIATRLQNATASKTPLTTGNEPNKKSVSIDTPIDQIDLRVNSSTIQNALNSAAETPVIDNARVDTIKQALSNGTYAIDPERIAQRISQFESPLTENSAWT